MRRNAVVVGCVCALLYFFPGYSYAQESVQSVVLGWITWFLTVVLLVYVAWCVFDFFREKVAEARQARERVEAARLNATGRILAISAKIKELKPIAQAVSKVLNEPNTVEIEKSLSYIETEYETAAENFAASDCAVRNPDGNCKSVNLYKAKEAFLEEKVLPHLEKVKREAAALEKRLKELRELIQNPQKRIDEAVMCADSVQAKIKALRDAGYKTGQFDEDHVAVKDMVAEAVAFRKDKAYLRMEDACKRAIKALFPINKTVNELPHRVVVLKIDLRTRSDRADQIEERTKEGRIIFDRMLSEYSKDLLAPIYGNGTEAEKCLRFARNVLEQAETAASWAVQNWDEAQSLLGSCDSALNEAALLVGSIEELDRSIKNAMSEVVGEIEFAKSDIEKARILLAQNENVVDDGLEVGLKESERLLAESLAEMAKSKPHFIQALKHAREANRNVDSIYALLADQYELANRQCRQRDSLLREAKRSIDIAGTYIQLHRRDIRSWTRRSMDSAEEFYKSAVQASLVEQAIYYAGQAYELADETCKQAKMDVVKAISVRASAKRDKELRQSSPRVTIGSAGTASGAGTFTSGNDGSINWETRKSAGGFTGW